MHTNMFASSSLLIENGDMWLLTSHTDILMRFRISDMRLEEYYIVPAEYLQKDVHVKLENTSNGIYILPCIGNRLFFFNKSVKKIKEISLSILEQKFAEKRKFHISAFWNRHLFLVGHDIECIYILNEETGHISKEKTYLDILRIAGAKTEGTIFSDCAYQDGNMFYMPLIGQSFILCMNLDDRTFNTFRISGKKKIRLCTIDKYQDDDKFLLTTLNDEKIIWSPKKGLIEWKDLGILGKEKSYLRAYHINNKNYYIPTKERKIYVEKEGIIKMIPYVYPLNLKYPEYDTIQYEVVERFADVIYFQTRDGHLFYIDTIKDEICDMRFYVSSEKRKEIKGKILDARNIPAVVEEKYCFYLEDYLEMIIGQHWVEKG